MASTETSYRLAFERLWEEQSRRFVSNGKPEHAAALFTVFLRKSRDSVVFFCNELSRETFDDGEVLSAFEDAIGRNLRVKVFVQTHAAQDSKFAAMARNAAANGKPVELIQDLPEVGQAVAVNFAIADDHAFRFEPNKLEPKAVAAAWSEETVKLLKTFLANIERAIAHAAPVSPGVAPSV